MLLFHYLNDNLEGFSPQLCVLWSFVAVTKWKTAVPRTCLVIYGWLAFINNMHVISYEEIRLFVNLEDIFSRFVHVKIRIHDVTKRMINEF